MSLRLQVIVGSTRPGRFSEKPAHWILEKAQNKPEVEAELLDLREYPLPFFDEPLSPSSLKAYSSDVAVRWSKKITEGDGYIMVTPEYNHGYSAVLKNALDYAYYPWNRKAVGFVSYGGVSGARSIEQLRLVAVELQMAPVRNSVHIPVDLFGELKQKDEVKPGDFSSIDGYADSFLDQLIWWTRVLKKAREEKL
ncbi:MAG: NADPH-dependent FMN reductase [Chitinispirillaceae bacterium]